MYNDKMILEPVGLAALGRRFDDAWCELEARSPFTSMRERNATRTDLARFLFALYGSEKAAVEGAALVDAYLRSQFLRKRHPVMCSG